MSRKTKFLSVFMFLVAVLVLSACSSTEYYVIDQKVVPAYSTGPDEEGSPYIKVQVVNPDTGKAINNNEDGQPYLYFDTEDDDTAKSLSNKNVWVVLTKYNIKDTDTSKEEFAIDSVFETESEAKEAFPVVLKTIPTKVSKKVIVEKNGGKHYFVHLVLEEEDGRTKGFYPFKVSKEQFDTLNKGDFYKMNVQIVGPNLKVLNLQDKTTQIEYDEFMKEQAELKKS